jgi:hypothetical protein
MIAMRVRDDGARHGLPRIDVKISGFAVEAAGRRGDKLIQGRACQNTQRYVFRLKRKRTARNSQVT